MGSAGLSAALSGVLLFGSSDLVVAADSGASLLGSAGLSAALSGVLLFGSSDLVVAADSGASLLGSAGLAVALSGVLLFGSSGLVVAADSGASLLGSAGLAIAVDSGSLVSGASTTVGLLVVFISGVSPLCLESDSFAKSAVVFIEAVVMGLINPAKVVVGLGYLVYLCAELHSLTEICTFPELCSSTYTTKSGH
ncbi:MAG: hypothetical protein ACJATW_001158 [Glaciecola sp.]